MGIRFDITKIRRRSRALSDAMRADKFRPEMERFVADVLKTCVRITPARDAGVIHANQQKQYSNRINYIPSIHTLEDPTLIVKGSQHWLYSGGKWYLANEWRLPQHAYANYQSLLDERNRRIESIPRGRFIKDRKQARFLYQRSWTQVASSLRVPLNVAGHISRSVTRRRPPAQPRRAYGQWRGGKDRLTAIIYNPFLDSESAYKDFNARDIWSRAERLCRPAFTRSIQSKLRGEVARIART